MKNNKKVLDNINRFKIVIIGCGGLGSNIAHMLVRSGIKKLTIVDFDTVCESNLNRQFYFKKDIGKLKIDALEANLKEINQKTEFFKISEKITSRNFDLLIKNFDILIEACDSIESKKSIFDSFLKRTKIDNFLICGSGMAGIKDANLIRTEKLGDNIFICGDGITEVSDEIGIMAPRVMITAAHQANIVLRIIAGEI